MKDILIKNVKVYDYQRKGDVKDIYILDGKIKKIGNKLDKKASKVINGKGLYLFPGLVDPHVDAVWAKGDGDAGLRMLLKAGVTTATDFKGPVEFLHDVVKKSNVGLNIASLNGVCLENGFNKLEIKKDEIKKFAKESMKKGSIGLKIMGGHFPITFETSKDVIQICNDLGIYIAYHAGNSDNGSNILGMKDAVKAAGKNSLHIAHINSYCRGQIYQVSKESDMALTMLKKNKNLISESYLSAINGTSSEVGEDKKPLSHVTRNCLKAKGYNDDYEDFKKAILNKDCAISKEEEGVIKLLYGKEAFEYWDKMKTKATACFDVNPALSRIALAIDKTDSNFTVDMISTDGGIFPRNETIKLGLKLVEFGALTINELLLKSSYIPSRVLGLYNKGCIEEGFDADLTLVNPKNSEVLATIVGGNLAYENGKFFDNKTNLIILKEGEKYVKSLGLPYTIVSIKDSMFYKKKKFLKKEKKWKEF